MGRVRVKKVFKNPNRFFEFWLANLAKEVRNDSWKMSRIYSKALVSLRKYPIKLNSGKECEILSGFGPSICNILDKKLEEFACENSLSLSEALALGNSLSHSELLRRCIPKVDELLPAQSSLNRIPANHDSHSASPPLLIEVLPCPSSSPVVHSPATVDANALQLGPLLSEGDDSPSYYLIGRSYDIILLMDVRETFGMSKVKELMQTQTIRWEARSLPVGDFVWIAQDVGGPAKCEEIVLGLVIERKRADDLASSIVDGRFMEQKGRMQKLGFRKMYIFEECKSMYNLRISHETLLQAMVNAQLIDECDFVTCTSGEQCVAYLASVTRLLITKSQFNCAVYSDGRRPQESFGGDRLWGIPWTEYLNLGRKSPTLPLREQFGRHLLQIHSITGSKAEDIVGLFPTPKSLFAAYDSLASEDEKKAMLMQSSRSSGLNSTMHLQLTIVHRERNVVFVYINDNNHVLRVKEYITRVTDIPVGAQKLSFGGMQLRNNKKLKDYNLPVNAGLMLTLSQGHFLRYQIFVKVSFRNNPIRVRIGLGTTVKQIQEALSSSLQVPVNQLMLSHNRRLFAEKDADKALVDLGVKSDEVLELMVAEMS